MFEIAKPQRKGSELRIRLLIGAVIASVVLAILDGILREKLYSAGADRPLIEMITTRVMDFRFLADQAIYAATVFTVGAKFIEMRTVITIGFDKLNAGKMVVKGPDEDNIVWIGHRYGTQFEAQAVASVIGERLKERGGVTALTRPILHDTKWEVLLLAQNYQRSSG
ncbi:MAG TPA: hypothetical protein VHY79_14710 [Rhizomicrobium sp.]|jgi:hypothetical protein|nr:hypothetical protein [Rhizomicrobium sp.]